DSEAPAKPTTNQCNVYLNIRRSNAEKFGHFVLQSLRRLRRRPNRTAISAHVGHAVHRFHRRMGVKRILISRLDRLCNLNRARRRFLFASNKSSFMRGRFKPLPMGIGVESVFGGIVPFYRKSSA